MRILVGESTALLHGDVSRRSSPRLQPLVGSRPLLKGLLGDSKAVRGLGLAVAFLSALLATSLQAAAPPPDLSNLSFVEAFDSLCTHYSKHYAFSEWKGVDWQALQALYAPEIQLAQATADTSQFKLAMKKFAASFPDGHVRLRGDLKELYEEPIGGGFGLTLIQLTDGRVAVNRVVAGGPAEQAGIVVGALVEEWDGVPIQGALENADILWEGNPPATHEGVRLARLRRLARAPVGRMIALTYVNPDQGPATALLTAVDDSLRTWESSRYTAFDSDGDAVITPEQFLQPLRYEILPDGIGYLRSSILVEFDEQGNVTGDYSNIVASLHEAIAAFHAAAVSGVIVDVRDNPGGFDRLAAIFGGMFYDHTEVYEQASFYDDTTGQFEVIPEFTLLLEPQASHFAGPVVCLVNSGTASSAEGIAMAIQRLPLGNVMGFSGTHGSFGLVSGQSALPAGIGIQFTLGRSLDADSQIQIDSDHTMNGGIVPDVRIPVTLETVQDEFVGGIDVALEAARAFLSSITPVRLASFRVERQGSTAILTWKFTPPDEEASFHVWRSADSAQRTRLSETPIAGSKELRYVDQEAPAGRTTYWLQEIRQNGRVTWLGKADLVALGLPNRMTTLHPGHPTPFRMTTDIRFDIEKETHVTIAIHDVRGRVVRVLVDEPLGANTYTVPWDGRDSEGRLAPPGVYFCKLTAGQLQEVCKLTLLR